MTQKPLAGRQSGFVQLCDTWDMVVVHRVFRREFALLTQMVAGVEHGATRRSAEVAEHLLAMVRVLHHHHSGEDELLWPLLAQRGALPAQQLQRMEQQHERLDDLLVAAEAAATEWSGVGDRVTRHELVGLLEQLSQSISEHLDEEEAEVLPVVERCVRAQEWAQLGKRGMNGMPRSRMLVFLGYILEEASDAERTRFLRKLPPPARLAYRLVGQRRYRREITRLRQGLAT